MINKTLLLAAAAALSLSACGDKKTETASVDTSTAPGTTPAPADTAATDATGALENGTTELGQSAPVNAVQDAVGAVEGAASAAVVNTADGFIRNAALGDMYEIQSSELALQKSKSPAIREFAQMMIKDHKATTAELKKLAGSNPVPTELDARRQGFIDNLKAADGGTFDRTYVDQQTASHSETLTMLESYVDDGDNAQLKAFAQKIQPKVKMHADMVKKIDVSGADGSRG